MEKPWGTRWLRFLRYEEKNRSSSDQLIDVWWDVTYLSPEVFPGYTTGVVPIQSDLKPKWCHQLPFTYFNSFRSIWALFGINPINPCLLHAVYFQKCWLYLRGWMQTVASQEKKEFWRKVENSWRYGAGMFWMSLTVQAEFESVSSKFDSIVSDHPYWNQCLNTYYSKYWLYYPCKQSNNK